MLFWHYVWLLVMLDDNTVVLIHCKSYKRQETSEAVNSLFEHFGTFDSFIGKGKKVFIKPNILRNTSPETAITTHPEIIYQVAKTAVDNGCIVKCGDSPNFITIPRMVKAIYKTTGIAQSIEEAGGEMAVSASAVIVEGGNYLRTFKMLKSIYESDITINIAKAKTHAFTGYTGAVKNLFGVIPGPVKGEMHYKFPNASTFANAMIDICEGVKAKLHIIDSVIAMEGPGPSSGYPKALGIIAAGTNPYALDEVMVKIMGLDINTIPQIKEARDRDLTKPIDEINIIGMDLKDAVSKIPFKGAAPKSDPVQFLFQKFLPDKIYIRTKKKPIIQKSCIGCGICAKACPTATIEIIDRKAVIYYKECIKCYCCQELCPEKSITLGRVRKR